MSERRRERQATDGLTGQISHGWRGVPQAGAGDEGDAGCVSDEIGNLVGPAERRYMDVPAGWTSQGRRDEKIVDGPQMRLTPNEITKAKEALSVWQSPAAMGEWWSKV
jgi:hypothetical protein